MSKVAEIEEAEKKRMREKCEKIANFGINVFINRQLIYNYPEQVNLKSCSHIVPLTFLTLINNRYSRKRGSWLLNMLILMG